MLFFEWVSPQLPRRVSLSPQNKARVDAHGGEQISMDGWDRSEHEIGDESRPFHSNLIRDPRRHFLPHRRSLRLRRKTTATRRET